MVGELDLPKIARCILVIFVSYHLIGYFFIENQKQNEQNKKGKTRKQVEGLINF